MQSAYRFVLVVLSSLMLTGCEEPRIDTSSDQALAESLSKVRESLPSEQRAKFDELSGELAIGGVLASAFTKNTISILTVMQPYDGLNGAEFIKKVEQKKAEKAAEKIAERLGKISILEEKLAAFESEREKLADIVVENTRLLHDEDAFISSPDLFVSITNGLSIPIAQINFNYTLKSPDRAVPWDDGEGFFFH